MLTNLRDYFVIKHSGLFDEKYYLLHNPDVRRADIDPLKHFIKYGWKEGRNPSENFDTSYYLSNNISLSNYVQRYILLQFRRKVKKFVKNIFKSLPINNTQYQKLIIFFSRHFPVIFNDNYLSKVNYSDSFFPNKSSNLIDITLIKPMNSFHKKIGIHLHIYYKELIAKFGHYLNNMPFPYDLFVSVPDESAQSECELRFSKLHNLQNLIVKRVENRGRDISPFFCIFGEDLRQYEIIGHFHSKKSVYNQGATSGWLEYLLDNLLGSREQISKIITLLDEANNFGLIYPQNYYLLPYQANTWLANKHQGQYWCSRLNFKKIPQGYFDFPAGSMFWASRKAILPLLDAGFSLDDFPVESGQTDGTLAHTIERLFSISTINQGLNLGIIKDRTFPSWSSWRFDQYIQRPYEDILQIINSDSIKVIGFDLFDTLLTRPLLDPESVKCIVASQFTKEVGNLYLSNRALAEKKARIIKGVDVGIEDIAKQLIKLTGLSEKVINNLLDLEEQIEQDIIHPRNETIKIYQEAIKTGKSVIIVSDTFLPINLIIDMLSKVGIFQWDCIFISSETGLRKDTGEIFKEIFNKYNIKPSQFIFIGDNERSDYQIPLDMGCNVVHLLRPVELARGLPRSSSLVYKYENRNSIDEEITVGHVIEFNFSPIHFNDFKPSNLFETQPYNIGYSIVGPLLVGFSNWLIERSQNDGIEKFFFLSREGKIMKEVYDVWCKGQDYAPKSEYLILSRRCISVSLIDTIEDILNIAKVNYFPNTVSNFLKTRFGIKLSDEKWRKITKETGISADTLISIKDEKLGKLVNLLSLLELDIKQRSNFERQGLKSYIEGIGLADPFKKAIVDIGYGGTVQGYLNKLLQDKIHGYYLITEDRSINVAEKYNVIIRGCFGENINALDGNTIIFRNSFEIEKLLSSNEPQIEYYEYENFKFIPHYRELTSAELNSSSYRDQIHKGSIKYTEDLVHFKKKVYPNFRPSLDVAKSIMEEFLKNLSPEEQSFLSNIVLDDYYCGRGLV